MMAQVQRSPSHVYSLMRGMCHWPWLGLSLCTMAAGLASLLFFKVWGEGTGSGYLLVGLNSLRIPREALLDPCAIHPVSGAYSGTGSPRSVLQQASESVTLVDMTEQRLEDSTNWFGYLN